MRIRRCLMTAIVLSLGLLAGSARAAEFTVEKTDKGVTVNLDGKLFTEYLIQSGKKPVLWPIIGPTGKPMTRPWPMDTSEVDKTKADSGGKLPKTAVLSDDHSVAPLFVVQLPERKRIELVGRARQYRLHKAQGIRGSFRRPEGEDCHPQRLARSQRQRRFWKTSGLSRAAPTAITELSISTSS